MGTKDPVSEIKSRAPTRIDLAGGTLDLWPLYLFLDEPLTINLGINLYAEADLTIDHETARAGNGDTHVTFCSKDQKIEQRFEISQVLADHSPKPRIPPALELHYKLFRHFARGAAAARSLPPGNVKLSTQARSPAGAGLGGSSTLSIALVGALASWARGSRLTDDPVDPEKEGDHWIEIVRDIETTVIQVPAGMQDYFGAMYGGLQELRWKPGWHERQRLNDKDGALLTGLDDRLLLFYSGHSRNSGINNWALFKAFIDRDPEVRERFERINRATRALSEALTQKNWNGAGAAISQEWDARRGLAKGITTPEIDQALKAAAEVAPISAKICGAGGGGCFFVYVPSGDPGEKAEITKRVLAGSDSLRALPFQAVPRGLEVTHA